MKTIFLSLVFVVCGVQNISITAQIENWVGVDMGRIGYKNNYFELNMTSFDQTGVLSMNNPNLNQGIGPNESLSLGSLDFSFEVIGKNSYVFFDGSLIPNLLQGLVAKKKLEEKTTFASGNKLDILEFIPTRVAFGGIVAKYFGVYVGGQYMYSELRTSGEYGIGGIGGNQRGFGGHLLFSKGIVLVRYSYMYDWIRRDKKTFKGTAQTHEASLSVNFGDSGMGLVARAGFRTRVMDPITGMYNERDRKFEFYPSFQTFDRYVTIGIFASGLFSGVSYATAKTAGGVYGK